MTVSAEEFIRRFLVHVLPKGFVRIRHFGFMANYQRSASLELCRQLLGMAPGHSIDGNRSSRLVLVLSEMSERPMTIVERLTAAQIDVEIRFEMFLGYFVAQIPNRPFSTCRCTSAPTCVFTPLQSSQCEVHTVTSTSNNETLSPIIRLRQRSSRLDVLHPVTTSTRIPVLSP